VGGSEIENRKTKKTNTAHRRIKKKEKKRNPQNKNLAVARTIIYIFEVLMTIIYF